MKESDKAQNESRDLTDLELSVMNVCRQHNLVELEKYVAKGVDLGMKDKQGNSLIQIVIGSNKGKPETELEIIKLLCEKKPDIIDLKDQKILESAVFNNKPHVVKYLLQNGFKLEPGSQEYTYLLHSTRYHKSRDTFKTILAARGESKNYDSENIEFMEAIKGAPSSHVRGESYDYYIYEQRLADLLPYVSYENLKKAAKEVKREDTKKMLNERIKFIESIRNKELEYSISKGDLDGIDRALKIYGADVNGKIDGNKTALEFAMANLEYLQNKHHDPHLFEITKDQALKVVKHLVENGADVHKSTKLLGDNSIYSKAKEMERKGDGTSVEYLNEVQMRLNKKVIEKDQMERKLPKSFVKKILDSLVKIKNVLTRENVKMRKMEQLEMISKIAKEIAVDAEKKMQEPKKVHQVSSGDLKPPVTPGGKTSPTAKGRG